jgi:hypothetical protein
LKNKKYFFVISCFFLTQVDKLLNTPRRLHLEWKCSRIDKQCVERVIPEGLGCFYQELVDNVGEGLCYCACGWFLPHSISMIRCYLVLRYVTDRLEHILLSACLWSDQSTNKVHNFTSASAL